MAVTTNVLISFVIQGHIHESHNFFGRSSQEASKKQRFLDCCQEAGIVEVLPYHDCDVTSQSQPDYLFCLTRLQVENALVRFPVFITGENYGF